MMLEAKCRVVGHLATELSVACSIEQAMALGIGPSFVFDALPLVPWSTRTSPSHLVRVSRNAVQGFSVADWDTQVRCIKDPASGRSMAALMMSFRS